MVEMIEKENKKKNDNFLVSMKKEISKITWPTAKSLKENCKLVVLSIFIFGLGIYCLDLIVNKFLIMLNSFVFRIIG